jgi:hypothetical protein
VLRKPTKKGTLTSPTSSSLRTLHSRGFAHRDVRFPNVVRRSEAKICYMLIDYEGGGRLDGPWPEKFQYALLPNFVGDEGDKWTTKHDYWQLHALALRDAFGNETWASKWKDFDDFMNFVERFP